MSDYLNNLVARTLQRQVVVSPRIASLYEQPAVEPLPVSTADAATNSFEKSPTTASTIQPLVAPPPELQPPVPPLAPLPARHAIITNEAERIDQEVKISGATMPREHEPAPVRPVRFVASRTEDEIRPLRHEQSVQPAPILFVSRDTNDVYDSKTDAKQEGAPTIEPEIRGLEARLAALEVKRSDDTGRQETGRQVPTEVGQAIPPPAALNVSPLVGQTARGFENPPEPPNITVTIGRVDVRAVFPAPAEAPRRAAPPRPTPTTLTEYLQKRERGRR